MLTTTPATSHPETATDSQLPEAEPAPRGDRLRAFWVSGKIAALSPKAQSVLAAMVVLADDRLHVQVGEKELRAITGLSRSSVTRSTSELRGASLILRLETGKACFGHRHTAYRLVPPTEGPLG